jgi:hypothetical protein
VDFQHVSQVTTAHWAAPSSPLPSVFRHITHWAAPSSPLPSVFRHITHWAAPSSPLPSVFRHITHDESQDVDYKWTSPDELRGLLKAEFIERFPARAAEADIAIGMSLAQREEMGQHNAVVEANAQREEMGQHNAVVEANAQREEMGQHNAVVEANAKYA